MKSLPLGWLVPILFCATACHRHAIRPDARLDAAPSAPEILAEAGHVYGTLTSYQDEGLSVTRYRMMGLPRETRKTFRTAFSRPDRFRFEFQETGRVGDDLDYVVWKGGEGARSWWTLGRTVQSHKDLGEALSGATGVSGGTAYTIPSVLAREAAWKGCAWTDPASAYRIADAMEKGEACYRVQRPTSTRGEKIGEVQTPATRGLVTYWIGKTRHLLLRMERDTDFGSFATHDTVTWTPVVGQPIPDQALAFGH